MCVFAIVFLRQLKKRLAKNQLLRDMTAEFSSAPEVVDQGRTQAEKEAAEFQRDRQRYEEENMQRLTLTKEQKKKLRAGRMGVFDRSFVCNCRWPSVTVVAYLFNV